MDFGWDWLTRPFAEYIILPVFSWMNKFIHNYGLIIIIFAFLIKLVTYPLSLASTKSMKKMAALQPMLKELQDKYKDNPAKLQSELGRIYKEAGVNPLGDAFLWCFRCRCSSPCFMCSVPQLNSASMDFSGRMIFLFRTPF